MQTWKESELFHISSFNNFHMGLKPILNSLDLHENHTDVSRGQIKKLSMSQYSMHANTVMLQCVSEIKHIPRKLPQKVKRIVLHFAITSYINQEAWA
jgi:hypothetical protein